MTKRGEVAILLSVRLLVVVFAAGLTALSFKVLGGAGVGWFKLVVLFPLVTICSIFGISLLGEHVLNRVRRRLKKSATNVEAHKHV